MDDNTVHQQLDLLLIHPGAARDNYGELHHTLVAVEPPLWCRLIAGYVENRGFHAKIIDAEANNLDATAVGLDAFALRPRLVCIVAYGHQPSASTQQMDVVYQIAKAVRSVCTAKIVVVGGHVSALPAQTLRECRQIDYAVVGEGPITICQLLEDVRIDHIDGLVWRSGADNGQHIVHRPAPPLIEDLSQLQGNVWHKLPMAKYRAHNWQCLSNLDKRQPYASIYTSLGCPYSCSFCCINSPFGKRLYRRRDPKDVAVEMYMLYHDYGVRTFKITDEMFVLNENHYLQICRELIQIMPAAGQDLNIWCYSRVDTVRPENLQVLRNAGVRWLALGIESESAYVRDGVSKRLKKDDMAEVVRQIQAHGINVIANYIFGLPDDTMETMRATLQMALDLRTEWANFYSAMAYPGSPLYDEAVRKGWELPTSWSGYSQHSYEARPLDTRHIDGASVLKFRDDAFHIYFGSHQFLSDTAAKFGNAAASHVLDMTRKRLPRKLLDETYAPRARTGSQ